MANSFDSALVADTISSMAKTVLANRLAPLRLFTSDFSDEVRKPNDTIRVPIVSATASTSVNPTNFEPGSSTTVGKATVTFDHLFQPFGLSVSDVANGHRLERLVQINLDALADKIWSVAITPITTVNFGPAVVTTTTITPGSGHLATLWSNVSKAGRKGLVVTPTIYSGLIPTSTLSLPLSEGAYGFENGVYYASSFSGAVSGLDGFACSQDAVCVASALPAIDPSIRQQFAISETVTLEQLGISVAYNVWGSTSNRQVNASLEVMFGSAAGLTSGTMALII
ncbi:MAG: hypothetical protein FGM22_08240 [Burkholderiaceae bacterium]|nr:hypothetical protein [Burkholderiaceae bacterium]